MRSTANTPVPFVLALYGDCDHRGLVGSTRPFILIEDTTTHVIDIGFHIELSASSDEVELAMTGRSDEYSEIDWVDKSDVDQFCNAKDVIPVSFALLKGNGLTARQ